jgi:ribosome recycling factor
MFNFKDFEEKMKKAIESYRKELLKQRVGRANPLVIAEVTVSAYGVEQPLDRVASITAESGTQLAVRPWDRKMIPEIERAIHAAGLGLNPLTAGDVVRIPFPPLSEERRKEIVKTVRTISEQSKVGLRNLRRDANQDIKKLEKDHVITEDDSVSDQKKVQDLTDKYIKIIETLTDEKEKEIMTV